MWGACEDTNWDFKQECGWECSNGRAGSCAGWEIISFCIGRWSSTVFTLRPPVVPNLRRWNWGGCQNVGSSHTFSSGSVRLEVFFGFVKASNMFNKPHRPWSYINLSLGFYHVSRGCSLFTEKPVDRTIRELAIRSLVPVQGGPYEGPESL